MRLLLIRHGETFSNLGRLLDTARPGAELTPLGQRQAAALPAALAEEDIDRLYVSTLVRTQQTAAPLAAARGLEPLVRDGLRELSAGDLELRGDEAAGVLYMRTAFAWSAGDLELRMPGGESGTEALARLDEVVAEAARSGSGTVAMISHGAAIRMWAAARAENVDVPFAARHPLDNTGVVVLDGTPEGGWKALSWMGSPLGGPTRPDHEADSPAGRPVGPESVTPAQD
ncbi:isomerase [Kitasatospora herbaricolor]|uniref:histidine phosphatase family protein n=1 Tax=Kitasatospora herbaricolor TaxID=68217 RepID=UPI00174BFACD|nr:histidine phosphatase family protein [Kitasatospora herbaricolor]MDQ0310994.1 putative phosphoglycerate mutase [Kitasatospora herbaricolor]GGV32028.1 isomerase [Kitasatospora herbaricolor]